MLSLETRAFLCKTSELCKQLLSFIVDSGHPGKCIHDHALLPADP